MVAYADRKQEFLDSLLQCIVAIQNFQNFSRLKSNGLKGVGREVVELELLAFIAV